MMNTMMASTSGEVVTIDLSDDDEDNLYLTCVKDKGGCFMKFHLGNDSGQYASNQNNTFTILAASDAQIYNKTVGNKTKIIDENDLEIKDDCYDGCIYYNDIKNNEEMGTLEESIENTKAIENGDNNKYECDDCDKTYSTARGLQKHEKTHGITTFECDRCNKCFSQFNSLNNHRKTHPPLECSRCYLTFSSQAEMDEHDETHAPPPKPRRKKPEKSDKSEKSKKPEPKPDPFKCHECDFGAKTFKRLKQHGVKSHKLVLNQCYYCNEILKSREEREKHKYYDCPKNKYKCRACLKRFPYDTTLKKHRMECERRKSVETQTDEDVSVLEMVESENSV